MTFEGPFETQSILWFYSILLLHEKLGEFFQITFRDLPNKMGKSVVA